MYKSNKKRVYISDIVADPVIILPPYYTVSQKLIENEMLLYAIESLHSYSFENYYNPKNYDELFKAFDAGGFPIYKERYIVANFSRLMYLESNGWRSMVATEDIFKMENWLIC